MQGARLPGSNDRDNDVVPWLPYTPHAAAKWLPTAVIAVRVAPP